MPVKLESWVPPAARDAILKLHPRVDAASRAVLDRLSTFAAMTNVWPKLAGIEGQTIKWCLRGHWYYTRVWRPPFPATQRKSAWFDKYAPARISHDRKYGPPQRTFYDAAHHATQLLLEMEALDADSRAAWALQWRGDAAVSYDKLRDLVRQCAEFYKQLEEELQEWIAAEDFLEPGKPRAEDAPQIGFSNWLAEKLKAIHGPNPVVSILTEVVFDLKAGTLEAETIRGRRRQPKKRKIRTKI